MKSLKKILLTLTLAFFLGSLSIGVYAKGKNTPETPSTSSVSKSNPEAASQTDRKKLREERKARWKAESERIAAIEDPKEKMKAQKEFNEMKKAERQKDRLAQRENRKEKRKAKHGKKDSEEKTQAPADKPVE